MVNLFYQGDNKKQENELENILKTALKCLDEGHNFEAALTQILFIGGQSRIYGTVCGAVLGCLSGYTRIPAKWLEGLHPSVTEWLNDRLNHQLDMMGLP